MDKHLNIVAFNIPWPANYGGIIDVFYKLKALHACGVKIILHCFEYERPQATALEELCEEIYYYKRHTGVLSNITLLPYNVYSRKHPRLLSNLLKNDYPILFEGLHCCYYMSDPRLKNRIKIYREANIEHDYYHHLAKAEKHLIKKCFYQIEAWRFKRYQKVISHADLIIAVSTTDADYLQKQFPYKQIEFMPCFHTNNNITIQPGISKFILYHGKLSVVENRQAVLYLIKNVFSQLNYQCIIAGMDPPKSLFKAAAPYPNIRIEANPTEERMNELICNAQIHMLITFQATGLKLKLLNSLFAGKHTVVNQLMVIGSGLESLCHIANNTEEMIQTCQRLMQTTVDSKIIEARRQELFPVYSNTYQGERLMKMIFKNQ